MGSRRLFSQLRCSEEYRGRWVALDECRYDSRTAQPIEGSIVDSDEDLASLCGRMQASDNKHCAVVFCEPEEEVAPVSARTPRPPSASSHDRSRHVH